MTEWRQLLQFSLGMAPEPPSISPFLPAIISVIGTLIAASISGYILITTSRRSLKIGLSSHLRGMEVETLARILALNNENLNEVELLVLSNKSKLIIDKRGKSGNALFEHLDNPATSTIDEFGQWKSELLTLSSNYIQGQHR